MTRGPFVVEFRSGSLFRGPRSPRGGTLGEAMRFQQERHAIAYLDRHAPWAWFNGACVLPVAAIAIANQDVDTVRLFALDCGKRAREA